MTGTVGGADQGADQEALAIMSARIRSRYGLYGSLRGTAIELAPAQITDILADGLSALAEAGYTVVKTEWEYGTEIAEDDVWYPRNRTVVLTSGFPAVRRIVGPWVPVPEGDDHDG